GVAVEASAARAARRRAGNGLARRAAVPRVEERPGQERVSAGGGLEVGGVPLQEEGAALDAQGMRLVQPAAQGDARADKAGGMAGGKPGPAVEPPRVRAAQNSL